MHPEFSKFFDDNYKPLFRFFYYKGLNIANAEDVVSETFYRYLKKYPNTSNKSILWGIAKNVYKEYVRNSIASQTVQLFEEIISETENDYDEYYDDEYDMKLENLKQILKNAINTLNPNVRKVIESRFYNGLNQHETAEFLGLPLTTIKKYQTRGINYIKKLISKNESLSTNNH